MSIAGKRPAMARMADNPVADCLRLDAHAGLVYGNRGLRRARSSNVWRAVSFSGPRPLNVPVSVMKIKNSLKSLKGRHRANRLVRRRGRVYIINKVNPRYKARQG